MAIAPDERLFGLPSLDSIARDPGALRGASWEVLAHLRGRCAAAFAAIETAQLESVARRRTAADPVRVAESDRALSVDQAAQMIGCKRAWIYRHAAELPFLRRLSRKKAVVSELRLKMWMAART